MTHFFLDIILQIFFFIASPDREGLYITHLWLSCVHFLSSRTPNVVCLVGLWFWKKIKKKDYVVPRELKDQPFSFLVRVNSLCWRWHDKAVPLQVKWKFSSWKLLCNCDNEKNLCKRQESGVCYFFSIM